MIQYRIQTLKLIQIVWMILLLFIIITIVIHEESWISH